MTNHTISPVLGDLATGELEWECCDGKSSIRRAANMLAAEGVHRSLSDFQIFEARLLIACSFDS
jgi:hypothetical protein